MGNIQNIENILVITWEFDEIISCFIIVKMIKKISNKYFDYVIIILNLLITISNLNILILYSYIITLG